MLCIFTHCFVQNQNLKYIHLTKTINFASLNKCLYIKYILSFKDKNKIETNYKTLKLYFDNFE